MSKIEQHLAICLENNLPFTSDPVLLQNVVDTITRPDEVVDPLLEQLASQINIKFEIMSNKCAAHTVSLACIILEGERFLHSLKKAEPPLRIKATKDSSNDDEKFLYRQLTVLHGC